jgi:integrase
MQLIFKAAQREELIESSPAIHVERPKLPRRDWRILEPGEIARVAKAFTDEQARVVFLTVVLTGLRRSELQRLRWRDVDLLGGVLRVRESKSEEGVRAIALASRLIDELAAHYARTSFKGDDERVFGHPELGSMYRAQWFKTELESALAAAGIGESLRPFHDLRHASLTNGAAAGENPVALMARAGHASMATTKVYLHLAGVVFRDEAQRLEDRLLGESETPVDPAPLGN